MLAMVNTQSLGGKGSTLKVHSATLKVVKGPDKDRTAKIEQPTFIVGSGTTADLRLADPSVSREHLRISLGPDGVRLRDDGSKNGTYLGAARVHEVTLTADATLTVGTTTLQIQIAKGGLDLALSDSDRFGDAIGTATAMRHLFARLELAAQSELTILLEGESGAGKDVLWINSNETTDVYVNCETVKKVSVEKDGGDS